MPLLPLLVAMRRGGEDLSDASGREKDKAENKLLRFFGYDGGGRERVLGVVALSPLILMRGGGRGGNF